MKLTYTVVYERGPNNLSAYVLDLPGCVSIGDALRQIRENIREAITLHIDIMLGTVARSRNPRCQSTKPQIIITRTSPCVTTS